ncbi:MAG: hypothetical protein IKF78_10495 [Atopobiaceae bacterium]|nr:hypothetical protein [Atopobiaceae bacterium]
MDYSVYEEPEGELNLKELMWDLLGQWKAILIVALLAAIIVPGAKYLKDTLDYKKALKQAEQTAAQASVSADEQIEGVLSSLSQEDRDAVSYLLQQQAHVKSLSTYLNESIWLNANPYDQRYMLLQYYVKADGDVNMQPLASAYAEYLKRSSVLTKLSQSISPDAKLEYIGELIKAVLPTTFDGDSTGLTLNVVVVLTEDANADAVAQTIEASINEAHAELQNSVGGHTIQHITSQESRRFDNEAVDRKSTLTTSLNSMQTSIKTATTSLTSEQKAAMEKIKPLIATQHDPQKTDGSTSEPAAAQTGAKAAAPSFSKKFVLIGFALGLVAYMGLYLLIAVLRGTVNSADELEGYIGARLLGGIYYPTKHKGFGVLMHSKLVEKRRYANVGDVATQIEKAASTMASVCEHASAQEVAVLQLSDLKGVSAHIVNDLLASVQAKGIQATLVDARGDVDEKLFLPLRNVVILADNNSRTAAVWKTTQLCLGYDVTRLGGVYLRAK